MKDNKTTDEIFGKAIPQLIHDIRNPLNIVVGFSSIVQIDESINAEVRSYLKKIFQSGMYIEQLLSNVDFYMMDNVELEENEFDILAESENFYKLKNEVITEKNIIIVQICPDKIKARFSMEIFTRILENFFQFSQKGFNSSKLKQIQIFYKLQDNNLVIYYTDSSEPIFIENDYFDFEEVLKAKRGLGLEFNRKFITTYGGKIIYQYGKKWQNIADTLNPSIKTNHGFVIELPIIK
jgi:light-regulated signal transduction histidine kinase (bacteriophytochrome)